MSLLGTPELRYAIECNDVPAVDHALGSGVSPDAEIDDGWRKRPLLFYAAKVRVLDSVCFHL